MKHLDSVCSRLKSIGRLWH